MKKPISICEIAFFKCSNMLQTIKVSLHIFFFKILYKLYVSLGKLEIGAEEPVEWEMEI